MEFRAPLLADQIFLHLAADGEREAIHDPVAPLAQKYIDSAGLTQRIQAIPGDFFKDEFPKADVVTMGNILHGCNLHDKKMLICAATGAYSPRTVHDELAPHA
jgi:hypothetical protein